MSDSRATSIRVDTLALRRDLWSEGITAAPLGNLELVAHADDDVALNELRVFLGDHLAAARPRVIARHLLPEATELRTVSVAVTRTDVPPRLRAAHPIAFACVVIPQQRDHWVVIPALGHTFYLHKGEELEPAVAGEVQRVLDARVPDDVEWRRLLPPAEVTLAPIDIVLHLEGGAVAASKAARQAAVDNERKRVAGVLLASVAESLQARLVARPAPALVGRDRELAEIEALLAGRERLSVLLIGDEAVGKTALLEAWAARHRDRAVWVTSVAQLVAGASGLGEWQARVAAVLDAAELLDAILYFDDFGALFGERPEAGGVDVGAVMRRHVTNGRVRIVGELGLARLDLAERRDVALIGAMTRVRVEPLDPAQTLEVLRARVEQWARTEPTRPTIAGEVLAPIIELARRYLPYRAFPGKAVRFLEELRATREGERDAAGLPGAIGLDHAYDAFALVTGIPAFLLRDDRALIVDQVIERFRSRMIGQDEAVRRVAETICVVKAQLQPADKPLATFLFVGPTGVGKTELARTLAELLFGAPDRLVRFDMSEYADPWAAERLIRGSEAGDGRLTARVREQPFCVVLLDEIEKAHAAVFDLLLQVCGEGRLTDGRGRTTYFHNAIIIMTSNLGAVGARAAVGIAPADPERDRRAELDRYQRAVATAFRPEMVNRIDRVIAFHRLSPEEVARVAHLAIARLADRRGLGSAGIGLDVSPRALAALAAGGYSERYGVRALRRHLDDRLIAPAARMLARLGAEARGGIFLVRIDDELDAIELPIGSRLGLDVDSDAGAGVAIALYRRAATSSKRALRGVAACSEARRDADRLLRSEDAIAVRDQIAWLRGQLVTAQEPGKRKKKQALSGVQLAAMQTELSRLTTAWDAAQAVVSDLRAAEELALTALAGGGDADDIAAQARELALLMRRRFFWVLVARQERRDALTLALHGPDHAAALERWLVGLLDEAPRRGWTVQAHLRSSGSSGADKQPGWPEERAWGPPRTVDWLVQRMTKQPGVMRSVLLRLKGPGVALLLGREAGLHRFHDIDRVTPVHLVVHRIARTIAFTDGQWLSAALGAAWPTTPTKGPADREHPSKGQSVWVVGKATEVEVPWSQHFQRLEEVGLDDLLARTAKGAGIDELWPCELDTELVAAEEAQ